VDKAPPEVITKEREKHSELLSSLKNLSEQYTKIQAL